MMYHPALGQRELGHPYVSLFILMLTATDVPSGRFESVMWSTDSGQLWVFGGSSYTDNFNDLWMFDGQNWAWMAGYVAGSDQQGVYEAHQSSSSTTPGARGGATGLYVVESLYLFGGSGTASQPSQQGNGTTAIIVLGMLNDLWKFALTANSTVITGTTGTNNTNIVQTTGSVVTTSLTTSSSGTTGTTDTTATTATTTSSSGTTGTTGTTGGSARTTGTMGTTGSLNPDTTTSTGTMESFTTGSMRTTATTTSSSGTRGTTGTVATIGTTSFPATTASSSTGSTHSMSTTGAEATVTTGSISKGGTSTSAGTTEVTVPTNGSGFTTVSGSNTLVLSTTGASWRTVTAGTTGVSESTPHVSSTSVYPSNGTITSGYQSDTIRSREAGDFLSSNMYLLIGFAGGTKGKPSVTLRGAAFLSIIALLVVLIVKLKKKQGNRRTCPSVIQDLKDIEKSPLQLIRSTVKAMSPKGMSPKAFYIPIGSSCTTYNLDKPSFSTQERLAVSYPDLIFHKKIGTLCIIIDTF